MSHKKTCSQNSSTNKFSIKAKNRNLIMKSCCEKNVKFNKHMHVKVEVVHILTGFRMVCLLKQNLVSSWKLEKDFEKFYF